MLFLLASGSLLLSVCLSALAGCSLEDGSNADPDDIAVAPSVHITIENSSSHTLNLPMVSGAGSGWLRVDEHPSWFGPGDTTLDVEFTAEQFPSCAVDR